MADKQGRLSSLGVSTDGGATYTALQAAFDLSFNVEKSEIDTSDRGSGSWSDFIEGRKSATIDGSVNWDVSDGALMTLLDASFADGTVLGFRFRVDTVAGERQFVANGFVTKFAESSPGEDKSSVDISIRLTGTVVKSTQT
jgi:predicted secreted protein